MPRNEDHYDDDEMVDDEMMDEEFQDDDRENNKKMAGAASWVMSGLIHLLLIAALTLMVIANPPKPVDKIITTTPIPDEEEQLDEEKEIDVVKEKAEVVVVEEVQMPPMVTEQEPEDHNETENEMESETAEGVSEAISDLPLVGSGVMGNIGGGGGGGGSFGQRSGGGRKRAVMRGGGSKATESAVDWALWWLANHQEDDGHWDTGKWEGAGTPETDVACSAAALLAFLGAGHTDRAGKFKVHVRKSIDWLLKAQRPNGAFDTRNYANGICTMAIAEAAGMGCGGSEVRRAAELAVDYLLKQQHVNGGFDYTKTENRDDMSVSGWCVMGLKSAMISGIREADIKAAFHKFGDLMDKETKTTGDNTSGTKGQSWYATNSGHNGSPTHSWQATGAIAMLMRQYMGWKRSEPWLEAAATGQSTHLELDFKTMNVYRVYYAYLALFQQGGKAWEAWNKPVSEVVVKAQRMDGDFKGSWDNNGAGHMEKGGRVLTTAFLCLSLEVFYRYQSVMK